MALQELIYTSLATPAASQDTVQDILKTSQQNNSAREITGLLLFDGLRYIQILEGTSAALDQLYTTISKDPRHTALERLHRGPVARRAFDDWRMAYEALPPGLLEGLAESMAVHALENDTVPEGEGGSFGARLNAMFMDAVAAE